MENLNQILLEKGFVYVCTDCEKELNIEHINNGSNDTHYVGSCVVCGAITYNTISPIL